MDLLSALILSGCAASQADPQETFAEKPAFDGMIEAVKNQE